MKIKENKVAEIHYTLTDQKGQQLDSSRERGPLAYLHGAGNIIPGLEKALEGRKAGDEFTVTVPPEEAYGASTEANIQRIPLKRLGKGPKPRPGQVLTLHTNRGPAQVTVVKVGRFNIDVDANHPLAGQALTFEVEVVSVRNAAEEELSHGHAHGPGGHDHG